ncbi:MAG: polysaccharide pyruvyl transferase family protein [Brevefilum sp.]
MKKAGILTFHNAENYGAALQTYALMKTLESLGLDVRVVDYRNRGVFIRNLLKNLFYLGTFQNPIRNHRVFLDFQKNHLHLTEQSYFNQTAFIQDANQFDLLFFGSDQIWNPDLANGFDPLYFGAFQTEARKIAYAASLGKDEITTEQRKILNALVEHLDAIGVREETMLPLIEREATCVVDPCMLLSAEDWREIADNPLVGPNFIFVYQLFNNRRIIETAVELQNKVNKEVLILSPYPHPFRRKGIHKLGRITPNEFIAHFDRAAAVLSDSFHGTLFSILFKKPFYSILPGAKTGRITTLLQKLGLSDRIVNHEGLPDHGIDFSLVTPLLDREVQKSLNFIRRNIQ